MFISLKVDETSAALAIDPYNSVDMSILQFLSDAGLKAGIVEHHAFLQMIHELRNAPANYVLPSVTRPTDHLNHSTSSSNQNNNNNNNSMRGFNRQGHHNAQITRHAHHNNILLNNATSVPMNSGGSSSSINHHGVVSVGEGLHINHMNSGIMNNHNNVMMNSNNDINMNSNINNNNNNNSNNNNTSTSSMMNASATVLNNRLYSTSLPADTEYDANEGDSQYSDSDDGDTDGQA